MYAIKLELKLNNAERTLMAQHAGFSRFVYNYGLALYKQVMDIKGGVTKKISTIRQVLTNLTKKKPEYAWMNQLSSRVYQNAFIALKNGLTRFFKGLGKFPVFKRKKDRDSFTVDSCNGLVTVSVGNFIKIPTLGTFRLYEPVPFTIASQTFTVSRHADKWYVSFAEKVPPLFHKVEKVGIDLGVKTFATFSDGTTIEAPASIKQVKIKLAKLQWRNRNKQLGNKKAGIPTSNNANKYYRQVAKLHAKITNIRRDFLQKLTTKISQKYHCIRIEDLNISGMMANSKLADAISNLGLYELRRQLTYKQSMFSTVVELVNRWFPSSKTCSECGHIQPMKLSDRVFHCQGCGSIKCRDFNASLNLEYAPPDKVRRASPELNDCGQSAADSPGRSSK
ncbi:IS200/IS605 family element transposase accessory protein TnpB [Planktothrix sp. FACHB-1355]|uniref:RNA-guided endonuclease InsQ/TnpB family protein n=1 Tax=Planktothrix sp. FACHB-1355 TaxID=2692854 RepID=UPI00168BA778|nr:RNA-guided endonuclease TnpB family protein [Planktothrix sp. FACHB-1355]MBD3558454.1 IS200/IS605 family element transposase accessory protein TnpB [Planktothrix sp. FACHB-1355]